MAKYKVLFNPKSNNGAAEAEARTLTDILAGDELAFDDITKIDDVKAVLENLAEDERVVIAGGDGTLNHFINDIDGLTPKNDIFFFSAGSGNDFLNSIGGEKGKIYRINDYLLNLPTVTVNEKDYKFINGIGFGIDGYCCEVGDEMREKSDKPINYTGIAIKGLLFHFKPVNATVTVDGEKKEYKKVWLAPTMYGRFYGGGMIPTPDQKREDGKVSTMVFFGKGKIRTLMIFPNIFKGTHVKYSKVVHVFKGNEVTVEFDRPTALQIDGETIKNVTKYSVKTA